MLDHFLLLQDAEDHPERAVDGRRDRVEEEEDENLGQSDVPPHLVLQTHRQEVHHVEERRCVVCDEDYQRILHEPPENAKSIQIASLAFRYLPGVQEITESHVRPSITCTETKGDKDKHEDGSVAGQALVEHLVKEAQLDSWPQDRGLVSNNMVSLILILNKCFFYKKVVLI